jgi:hypothetical protein
MIPEALQFIVNRFNQFLNMKLGLTENRVIMNSLIQEDGTLPAENLNKLVFTVIHIREENVLPMGFAPGKSTPPVKVQTAGFSVNLLLSAHFNDYAEALKYTDLAMHYFWENPVFNPSQNPGFPVGLNLLKLEPLGAGIETIDAVWSAIGAKYQPSLMYTVRFYPL